jgi:hypothetical protein
MFLNLKDSYKFRCIFSRISLLLKPHTLQPYNRMGLIILSNISSRHFIDSLYILPIFKTSYIAFSALSARCFFCQIKISCSSKNNPKIVEIFNYLNIHIIINEAQIFKRTRQRSTLVWKNQILL